MIYYNNHYNILLANNHRVYEYDKNIGLEDIKRFMHDYHSRRRGQVCLHELGVDNHRFDFVSLNPHTKRIRILEYKVSKGDFNGDTKHLSYMGYCNTFSFVTPLGLVAPDDLKDKAIGLLQVFKWKRRNAQVNRWTPGAIWIKKPRSLPLNVETYHHVMGMMLLRLVQGRKGDFF